MSQNSCGIFGILLKICSLNCETCLFHPSIFELEEIPPNLLHWEVFPLIHHLTMLQ